MTHSVPQPSSTRHDRSRWIADSVRILAVLSVVAGAGWLGVPAVLGLTTMAAGLLFLRVFRLAGPFDAAFCVTIFIATWSGLIGLYRAISWWDLAVHFVTIGAVAAALYLILARSNVTPSTKRSFSTRSIVVLSFSLGLTVAVLWEFIEWIGNRYITELIMVGYDDTIGDLAVGGAGAALAGVALALWTSRAAQQVEHQDSSSS